MTPDPTHGADEATWRNRFILVNLVRIGGTVVVLLGLLVWHSDKPRSDLPVATPSSHPPASSVSMSSRTPSNKGSSTRPLPLRLWNACLYSSASATWTSRSASGSMACIASTRLRPTTRRACSRGGGGSSARAKHSSMARQILWPLSTSVPSQSKMARRFVIRRASSRRPWWHCLFRRRPPRLRGARPLSSSGRACGSRGSRRSASRSR